MARWSGQQWRRQSQRWRLHAKARARRGRRRFREGAGPANDVVNRWLVFIQRHGATSSARRLHPGGAMRLHPPGVFILVARRDFIHLASWHGAGPDPLGGGQIWSVFILVACGGKPVTSSSRDKSPPPRPRHFFRVWFIFFELGVQVRDLGLHYPSYFLNGTESNQAPHRHFFRVWFIFFELGVQ
jgi:hypothetical protein